MSKVRIELNKQAVRTEILQSEEILKACEEQAQKEGGEVFSFIGWDRAHALVYKDD